MANVMEFPDTVEEFMNLYKVVDSDHVYSNGVEFIPIYRMKQWFEHTQSKTNADRIRAMSDEELAMWINDVTTNALSVLALGSNKQTKTICYWLDWLKQEAE